LIGRSSSFLGAPTSAPPGGPVMMDASGKAGGLPGMAIQVPNQPGVAPGGGFGDVRATPTFQAFKDTADRQFQQGRENVLSTLPRGGALSEALVDLDSQRAATLTQGAGAIYGDELARAMTLATGTTGAAMSGLGSAGAIQAQMAANQAATTGSKFESLGYGAGAYLGGK
jgi:hypothetical protein